MKRVPDKLPVEVLEKVSGSDHPDDQAAVQAQWEACLEAWMEWQAANPQPHGYVDQDR